MSDFLYIGGKIRPPSTARSQTSTVPPVFIIPRTATIEIDAIITNACKTSVYTTALIPPSILKNQLDQNT